MLSIRRAIAPTSILALLPLLAAAAQAPVKPLQRTGKYAVELRIPSEGLFAGEETDVEFRVTDTSQDDPVQGAPPVVNARVKATVNMPSMPSMPNQMPSTHSEGVPGDYGVVLLFPHSGDYLISLLITPPADKPFTVSFKVAVKDRPPGVNRKPKAPPYTLEVKSDPVEPQAGQPTNLTILVRARDSQQPVADFDIVHERLIHFIVVSRDLSQFSHEHPEMGAGGKFTLNYKFPVAGEYSLFADVAPKDAGSQVLMQKIRVAGSQAVSDTRLVPSNPPIDTVGGIKVLMKSDATHLTTGRTLPLVFALQDDKTGAPISDVQPWLGAAAHLILVHQDAGTFVHSHPDETDPANGKNGTLTFLARFPKPGLYRGWLQFQRNGQVQTATMVIAVGTAGASDPSIASESDSSEKTPAKFACSHCGLPVTVKKQADWTKRCAACKCGKTSVECRPKNA